MNAKDAKVKPDQSIDTKDTEDTDTCSTILGGKKPIRRNAVDPKYHMQPGDVVTCEIEGIGCLGNCVAAA